VVGAQIRQGGSHVAWQRCRWVQHKELLRLGLRAVPVAIQLKQASVLAGPPLVGSVR
jgi:hypothetical protein